jgi:3-dehydroquinate synthase
VFTIQSRSHPYTVESFPSLDAALDAVDQGERAFYIVDQVILGLYGGRLEKRVSAERIVAVEATESAKSFELLTPHFLSLLSRGLKRDGLLVVIGGGVLQDVGCFIASVLFRGLRWVLIPTTLLSQADSCIGSKSSINIGSYKNQIGTFYPPHRVLLTSEVLCSLPKDEIRSGMGEIIKLQLIQGETGFRELMLDISGFPLSPEVIGKWVVRSMDVKKPFIEQDEFDRGPRNLLNYGHTFGHAYESASHYGIPHGIAVTLGILTATKLSERLGMVSSAHYDELRELLRPWHTPYEQVLEKVDVSDILRAIRHDKKNTDQAVYCILTEGPGRMKKMAVSFDADLQPCVREFILG